MKKQTRLALFAGSILLIFGGCAFLPRRTSQSSARPDWIQNWSTQYPSDAYLAGVGIGYTQASAEDFARGEIAKIFSAQVNVQESASQSETDQSSAAGNNTSSLTSSASQNVKTISHKVLEGSVIASDWQDPTSGQYYALAILDRQKAAASLSEQISDLDSQIQQMQSALNRATLKLVKAKNAMGIVTSLDKRRVLAAELRVVGQTGQDISSPVDAATAQSAAQEAMAALNVIVNISGDDSGIITESLIHGLGDLGIEARSGDTTQQGIDIIVSGSVLTSPENLGDSPWKRSHSEADIRVQDASNSKTIASLHPSSRDDSQDYETAAQRSLQDMATACAQQIKKTVSDYLAGQ